MDKELQKEIDEYMNEILPKMIAMIMESEVIKKQMDVQERIAKALEELVILKRKQYRAGDSDG